MVYMIPHKCMHIAYVYKNRHNTHFMFMLGHSAHSNSEHKFNNVYYRGMLIGKEGTNGCSSRTGMKLSCRI
jgi:anaerobic selenocysteine-containing dehydrogenase